jgi:hypothetical protein
VVAAWTQRIGPEQCGQVSRSAANTSSSRLPLLFSDQESSLHEGAHHPPHTARGRSRKALLLPQGKEQRTCRTCRTCRTGTAGSTRSSSARPSRPTTDIASRPRAATSPGRRSAPGKGRPVVTVKAALREECGLRYSTHRSKLDPAPPTPRQAHRISHRRAQKCAAVRVTRRMNGAGDISEATLHGRPGRIQSVARESRRAKNPSEHRRFRLSLALMNKRISGRLGVRVIRHEGRGGSCAWRPPGNTGLWNVL